MNGQEYEKKLVCSIYRHYIGILPGRIKENHENISVRITGFQDMIWTQDLPNK
jgi:hypothetical protein